MSIREDAAVIRDFMESIDSIVGWVERKRYPPLLSINSELSIILVRFVPHPTLPASLFDALPHFLPDYVCGGVTLVVGYATL
jgi:hypothetical protein